MAVKIMPKYRVEDNDSIKPKRRKRVYWTTETFKEQMAIVNPNIEVLGEYIKSSIPILCRCKIDGYEWEAKPKNLLSLTKTGKPVGCPKCAFKVPYTREEFQKMVNVVDQNIEILSEEISAHTRINYRCRIDGYTGTSTKSRILQGKVCPKCHNLPHKRTEEEFIQELAEINKDIKLDDLFIDMSTPTWFKCNIDNHRWKTMPKHITSDGSGCPKCVGKGRITQEEFVARVGESSPDTIIRGLYVNYDSQIESECRICGNIWNAYPSNLLNGGWCPKCQGVQKCTKEEACERLNQIYPNIEMVGEYKTLSDSMEFRCKLDDYTWTTKAGHVIYGESGCPMCSGKLGYVTEDIFVQRLDTLDIGVHLKSGYMSFSTDKAEFYCDQGHEWENVPVYVLSTNGCPYCKNPSRGERAVINVLDSMNVKYTFQKRFDKCKNPKTNYTLPFDIYLTEYNACIEYDGELHYKSVEQFGGEKALKESQYRDQVKTTYCKTNNIPLLRIPYWDFNNVENIVKTFVNELQGTNVDLAI